MLTKLIRLAVSLLLLSSTAQAVILYSGDNSANLTAPASGAPFESVARVCNDGGSGTSGSAVHIRGKYMLTASHVSNRSHITFDGSIYWERDTAFIPIEMGTTDMKLFKLLAEPNANEVILHTTSSGNDVSSTSRIKGQLVTTHVIGTLIGCGKGSAEDGTNFVNGNDHTWTWSSPNTKRWGTNSIDAVTPFTSTQDYNYSYDSLRIELNTDAGVEEAGLAVFDSGSGIFVENNGIWTLAGIATMVSTNGSSTFATSGDNNYFVRIQDSASAIAAAIPNTETYAGWKMDNSLTGNDALDTTDTDHDGIGQLHEFAFGGDPNANDVSILPTHELVEDSGSTYLEITLTRPINLQGIAASPITYTPQTTTDLANWPIDSTGILNASPTPVDNGDGTETLTYRRNQAVEGADQAFLRVSISE